MHHGRSRRLIRLRRRMRFHQHIPAILTRTIGGTEPKIMSVTYMQAGDVNVRIFISAGLRILAER